MHQETGIRAQLADVKAELQRVEERASKNRGGSGFSGSSHTKLTLKNDSKVNRRTERDTSQGGPSKSCDKHEQEAAGTSEDVRIAESRRKLEQKARLYEETVIRSCSLVAPPETWGSRSVPLNALQYR